MTESSFAPFKHVLHVNVLAQAVSPEDVLFFGLEGHVSGQQAFKTTCQDSIPVKTVKQNLSMTETANV